MEERPTEGVPRLAGGKTPESILGWLRGASFPAKKDRLIHAARANNAPTDVLWALEHLTRTDYAGPEEVIRDYPRLPEPDDLPNQGG